MFPSVRCPSCSRSLGQINADGQLHIDCPACRRSYGVVYGKVSGRASRWEAILYLTAKLPSVYKRRYELRITTPGRDLKVLKFSTLGRGDRVPVRLGDRISLLYAMRGSMMKKLISVSNHTVGKTYSMPRPIPTTGTTFRALATLSVALFFCVLISGYGFWLTTTLGAIAFLVATRVMDTAELTTPQLQPHDRQEARLIEERNLLGQKLLIQERVEALRQEGQENQSLIKQLRSLQEKMRRFDSHIYAARIQRIDRAIVLLHQRTQHDRDLVTQYEQTSHMIEIELETAYLADQLPDAHDFTGAILSRIAELKSIEERNREFRQEIEANEEVRRLSLG